MKILIVWILLLFIFTTPINAHSGRTDSSGGHNCYTGSCAGTYHYHNGGYSGGYTAPVYNPPKPKPSNPTAGTINHTTSASNWCNHDVTINWSGASLADGYSVGISKTAGADPGPSADTKDNSYVFKNITSGKWYVNVKALSSAYGTSANQVVYWETTLPQIEPNMNVRLVNDVVSYNFQCLSKIEAPEFLLTEMRERGNYPSGAVSVVPFGQAQTFTIKGVDKTGKVYEKTLTYNPIVASAQETTTTNESSDMDGLIGLGILGAMVIAPAAGILWLRDKFKGKIK